MTTFEGSISLTISICSMSMEAPESSNNSLILFFTQHTHTHTTRATSPPETPQSSAAAAGARKPSMTYILYTLGGGGHKPLPSYSTFLSCYTTLLGAR